jgi:predicted O-methyltransferase YrrM
MMLPPLVRRALALAGELGLEGQCTEEAGRLLHVLAGERGRVRVASTGTGAALCAAWIVSALDPSVPVYAVEEDERIARLFADDPHVHLVARDELASHAPFDLVSCDEAELEAVAELLAPRGTVVVTGLAPGSDKPRARHGLASAELLVSPSEAAVVAVRTL